MSLADPVDDGVAGRSWPCGPHLALAATSLAAAGIHFAVMPEHFDEYVTFGVFFSVVAWLQALWAGAVALQPRRWLLVAGLVGNLVVVVVWAVSRTAGLPLGPESGEAEAASFIDVLSTVLEVVIVAGCAVLLVGPHRLVWFHGRTGWVTVAVYVLVLAPLTSAAIASSTHGDGHGEHGEHDEHDEHESAPNSTSSGRFAFDTSI
jgi:multisubunit Na+/H+ antiporter MnhG subunit